MKNRQLITQGAIAVTLAMILGFPAVHAEEVFLQAEQYQKSIPYGSGAGVLPAQVIAVANAGFEDPVLGDGGFNSAVIGWTGTGGGTFNPTAVQLPGEASEGANTHYSNGGSFSQTLSDVLVEGTYTLSVDVGDRADTAFPAYQVQLGVDNGGFVLLAEDNSSLSPSNGFLTSTVTYIATAADPLGSPLVVRLVGAGVQVNFDNVRIEVTPSSATVTMWGYSLCESGFANCGAPSSPGPQLDVAAGDPAGLIVNVRNSLPEATSLMIAGQKPSTVTVNGAPATVLGRTADNRLRSFAPEIPAAVAPPVTDIAVANAGFEAPDCGSDGCFTGTIADWAISGGAAGVFKIGTSPGTGISATEGDQVAYSNGGTIAQVLGDTLTADTTYTLTVDVGDRANTNFPGYTVALYAGGVLLAQDSSLVLTTAWGTANVQYSAAAGDPQLGQPLEIRLSSAAAQTEFDNVILSAVTGSGAISTGTYSWSAADLRSGSFLYQSGSHVQQQVHMGLYGAMLQDAAGCGAANCVYADAGYDAQQVLIFSEVDPALHGPMPKPANATVNGYRPKFFLINGEPFDGSLPAAAASAGDNLLLRLINAGLDNHAIQLLGGHFEVLGEDGRRAPTSRLQYNALLPAAKAMDVLFSPTAAGTYPLFDRRMFLNNGPVHGGGMFHRVVID